MVIVSLHTNKRPAMLPLCRVLSIAAVLIIARCGVSQVQGAPPETIADATKRDRAAMLIDGVWNSIEKIHAADIRIIEVIESPEMTEEVEYRYGFDKQQDPGEDCRRINDTEISMSSASPQNVRA